jgi:hypothetical protein
MLFTDAMNRILHYKPVRDREGNVIYESENVVKQEWDPLDSVTNYMDDILVTSTLCRASSREVGFPWG